MIESSPAVVRIFHRLGARYLTLTHWRNVEWADAATDTPRADGLTKAGEMLVRELNRTGMFADIAHVSPDVMRDVLRVPRRRRSSPPTRTPTRSSTIPGTSPTTCCDRSRRTAGWCT